MVTNAVVIGTVMKDAKQIFSNVLSSMKTGT